MQHLHVVVDHHLWPSDTDESDAIIMLPLVQCSHLYLASFTTIRKRLIIQKDGSLLHFHQAMFNCIMYQNLHPNFDKPSQ